MDNNVLYDLVELSGAIGAGCLRVLNDLFEEVFIPKIIVDDEVLQSSDLQGLEYSTAAITTETGYRMLAAMKNPETEMVSRSLSEYDKHVIVLSKVLNCVCASNDGAIRKTCQEFGVPLLGTVGITTSAYEDSIISLQTMAAWLRFLFSDQSTCYLSPEIKKEVYDTYRIDDQLP